MQEKIIKKGLWVGLRYIENEEKDEEEDENKDLNI